MNHFNLKFIAFQLALGVAALYSHVSAQAIQLSMDKAVSLSLSQNKTLQISVLEKDKASEKIKEARGYMLPTIQASGQYLHYFQKQVTFLPGNFVGLRQDQIAALRVGGENAFFSAINLSQPVFHPEASAGFRSARFSEQVASRELEEMKNNIVAEVKIAYLNVLIAVAQQQLQAQSISRNELALKDARSMLFQGKASAVDTLRALVTLENLQPEMIRLTRGIDIAKSILKRSIGLDEAETIELTDSLKADSAVAFLSLETVSQEALRSSPELQKLEVNQRLKETSIQQQSLSRAPNLFIVGSLLTQTQANNLSLNEYKWPVSSYAGVQLNVPLLSGFRNISKVKQARISLLQSQKQLEDKKELIRTEVQVNIARMEEARHRIEVQRRTIAYAQLGFRITRDRWKQGISSRLDVSDAELSLFQSQSNYLRAVYDYQVAGIQLDKVTGKIVQDEQ